MLPKFGPQTISQEAEDTCAQEPIRLIGTVQPHGFVLVVDVLNLSIVQASTGAARHWPGLQEVSRLLRDPVVKWVEGWGNDPAALLGSLPLSDPIKLELRPRVPEAFATAHPSRDRFECVGHRVGGVAVLEWQSLGDVATRGEDGAMIAAASAFLKLRSANSMEDFYSDCVQEVSRICGFRRVMMYKFLPDWTGEVLAEKTSDGSNPIFLGLRFPASDIPSQARALYTQSKIRVLADVEAVPDKLVPDRLPDGTSLDQSHSALRGFSDVHRTYLGNMGVRATMSLSIVSNGKLWGLIACHHDKPAVAGASVRQSLRQVCELIAEVIALRIETLEQLETARSAVAMDQLIVRFQQVVVHETDPRKAIDQMLPRLLAAFQASALCVRIGEWCYVGGDADSAFSPENVLAEIAALFAASRPSSATLQMDNLLAPAGGGLALRTLPRAAGLLAVRQTTSPSEICAWTRPEIVCEVDWGGEPVKTVVTEQDGRIRLEPRRSFSLWKETVAGTARAWSTLEADGSERILRILSEANRRHIDDAREQDVRYRAHREHLSSVQRSNFELEREVGIRVRAEEDLRRVNETLEIRVADRTAQFEALNNTLVEEGERFAIAADAAGLGFWDLDFTTGLLAWDERMFRLFGQSDAQGEQPNSVWAQSLHGEDRERCEREAAEARSAARSYDTQYRIVHPNGAIRHLQSAGRVTRQANGQAIRMLGVAFDITERKHADEQFRLAIEAAPTAMLLMSVEGSIVLVNAQIEILFGYPRSELLGRPIDMLIPERFRQPDSENGFLRQPSAAAAGKNVLLYGLHKNGAEIPVDIRLNPLHTSEGEFVLSSIIDLSQRLEIDRIRDEFVSTVSHELRTPLTSINGALGLLESGTVGTLPDAAAELVRIAYKNSGRLARLINDILDVGALEAGEVRLKMVRVRLSELVHQAVEAHGSYAEKYKVRFLFREGIKNQDVMADPDRLTQVLTNMLSNAAKFSPPGADVFVRVLSAEATIRVEVEDHGPGISDEFRNRVFEKFAQADSTASRRFEGSGLGLSIARKLIEAMSGTIGFTSAVGQGTTFHLELPLVGAPGLAPAAEVLPSPDEHDRALAAKGLPNLLYVEDDTDLIAVIRATLAGRANLVAAHSIGEAERLLRQDSFELVILDQSLPDGNAITLVDRIPGLVGHSVPIIVLSAADVPNEMHRKVAAALAKTHVSAAQVASTILSYLPVAS